MPTPSGRTTPEGSAAGDGTGVPLLGQTGTGTQTETGNGNGRISRQTHQLYTPSNFRLPFLVLISTMTTAVQATMASNIPHINVTVNTRKKRDFPLYIPATSTTKHNMKFRDWMRLYDLYSQGELMSGIERSELARGLIDKFHDIEIRRHLIRLPDNVINKEGKPGDGSVENPPERGGLDIIYDIICRRYKDEDVDMELDDITQFEQFKRKPGQSMRTYRLDFEQSYYQANNIGVLDHSKTYLTHLFFTKGGIGLKDQQLILSQVRGDRSQFEIIKNLCVKILKDHRTDSQGGIFHADGHGQHDYDPDDWMTQKYGSWFDEWNPGAGEPWYDDEYTDNPYDYDGIYGKCCPE